jgi:hypothetical protein
LFSIITYKVTVPQEWYAPVTSLCYVTEALLHFYEHLSKHNAFSP